MALYLDAERMQTAGDTADLEDLPRTMSSPAMRSFKSSSSVTSNMRSDTDRESRSVRGNSSRRTTVGGKFVKARTATLGGEPTTLGIGGLFASVATFFAKSSIAANFMAAVVLLDAICTCIDVDTRALQEEPSTVTQVVTDACLVLYTIESGFLLQAKGLAILKDWMVLIDLFVIVCGYFEMILHYAGHGDWLQQFGMFRMLRLVRILRLTRLLRRTRGFRELQKLVRMMATCLKALFWSLVFLFMVMTVWALLIVEFINPIMRDIDLQLLNGCDSQCVRATSSVMHANLLLFKTVIAGDSWGLIAVPIIERHPETAILFMGSSLTLVFGVLNLIVAVVVDTFAEHRQRDVLNLAEELEYNHAADQKFLENIFQRIDTDGSGQVTFEELLEGARRDPEFQSRLRVMDIDEADLEQLFEMIDVNGEGEIAAAEFIAPLIRWVHDSKTAPRFIKYNVLRSLTQQEELYELTKGCFDIMENRMNELASKLEGISGPGANLFGGFQNMAQVAGSTDLLSFMTEEMECTDRVLELPAGAETDAEVEQPNPSCPAKPSWLHTDAEAQDALKIAVSNLERYVLSATEGALKTSMALVETALQDRMVQTRAGPLTPPPQPIARRNSKRLPSIPTMLENTVFERNRRASGHLIHRDNSRDSAGPSASSTPNRGAARSKEKEKLPAPSLLEKPPKRQSRVPVGSFNSPGAGLPAEAMPERWRRDPAQASGSHDISSWRRPHPGTGSIDVNAMRHLRQRPSTADVSKLEQAHFRRLSSS